MWSRKLSRSVLDNTTNTALKLQWSCLSTTSPIQNSEANIHSTIDTSDVKLFSKLMKDWWRVDGKMALLHRMNLVRVPFVRDGILNTAQKDLYPLKNKKILDVGCGGGILSEALARLGAQVTGIDASEELICVAEQHKNEDPKIANNKPTYILGTIEDHAKKAPNMYDGVVASEVVEHVNNQELFIKSCINTVKPGGRIFFTTPNRTRLSQFSLIFLGENILKAIPKGAHQYEKFITPNELTFILERNDCQVEVTYGLTYNPVTGKWAFSQYQHLVYALQARKLR